MECCNNGVKVEFFYNSNGDVAAVSVGEVLFTKDGVLTKKG